jgi:hypothetical protein
MSGPILFGWAETDITPKRKIALDGEFFERATDEVETPITVTALAVEAGGQQTVICSCDLVSISAELTETVRERVAGTGLRPESIVICAVHIHNSYTFRHKSPLRGAPSTTVSIIRSYMPEGCTYIPEVTSGDCMDPDEAFDYLADAITRTVVRAWESRAPGGFSTGFGRAAVGMNRRVCYSDGTARMWGDTDTPTFTELEGGNDSGIELLFVRGADGVLTGVVANVACPAQVMEQRSVISSDYWGKVKILLRRRYGSGVYLLPLCSAAGDQCPRDLIRWVEPETPIKDPNIVRPAPRIRLADPSMFDVGGTWKIGKRIFAEIEDALAEAGEPVTSAVHLHESKTLTLPLRRVTDTEYEQAREALREFFRGRDRLDYKDSAALHIHAGTIRRYEVQKTNSTVEAELHFIRLGPVVFATNPFELFLNYGNVIRARSAAQQTFLIQLANGGLSYLPTEAAEKHGHYSAYVSSGYVGHEGGSLLVDASLDSIAGLFAGDGD